MAWYAGGMPQPTPYDPSTAFDPFNPSSYPNFGRKVDVELANIQTTTDEILTNLALIQRDDGALANGVVTRDSLATEIAMGVNTPEVWATATEYSVRDSVIVLGVWYWCSEAHTSGVFATDLTTGYWEEIFDFTDFISELALSDSTPETIAEGAGSAGTSEFASRADHEHPYTDPLAGGAFLAITGTETATILSVSTPMTAKRLYRFTGTGPAVLPTMVAGDFVDVIMAHAAGTTGTIGRNSQTIDGASADDTWAGGSAPYPVFRYRYSSAGAVKSELLGSVAS